MSELKVGDVVSCKPDYDVSWRCLKLISDSAVAVFDDDISNGLEWQHGIHTSLIPEGFAIVPIEPTDEMIAAGRKECEGAAILPYHFYKAMINAAPKPTDK